MKKIRLGIIGCSSVAERRTIPAILKANNAELAFIGSRSAKKARKFAQKFSCRNFGSYYDVLENKNVDAVYISLPIGLQERWILNSAKSGKHILCEKSVTTSYKSAKKIVDQCNRNNVRVVEAFSFIYHPQQKKILEIIRKGTIGSIFSFTGKIGFNLPRSGKNFRLAKNLGGGALNDMGCYLIRASRLIFQDDPIQVECNLYFKEKNGVDVKGSILLKFPNERISSGLFSYCNSFQSTYDVWGSKGLVSLTQAFNLKPNIAGNIELELENKKKKVTVPPRDQFEVMIQEFCKIIMSNSLVDNGERDLLSQALILEKARQSNDRKKPVVIHPIQEFM